MQNQPPQDSPITAQFIAHAPTDIDALLEIAEARRQEIDALTIAAAKLARKRFLEKAEGR